MSFPQSCYRSPIPASLNPTRGPGAPWERLASIARLGPVVRRVPMFPPGKAALRRGEAFPPSPGSWRTAPAPEGPKLYGLAISTGSPGRNADVFAPITCSFPVSPLRTSISFPACSPRVTGVRTTLPSAPIV